MVKEYRSKLKSRKILVQTTIPNIHSAKCEVIYPVLTDLLHGAESFLRS